MVQYSSWFLALAEQSELSKRRHAFGFAWVAFAVALALHVYDEATQDFLSVYNPAAEAIRHRLPFLPLPTFTFAVWLTGLCTGIALLLLASPLAFRNVRWLRVAAWPLGIVVGILNASLHLLTSAYYHRWMPGVLSSPLLLVAAVFLLLSASSKAAEVAQSPEETAEGKAGTPFGNS